MSEANILNTYIKTYEKKGFKITLLKNGITANHVKEKQNCSIQVGKISKPISAHDLALDYFQWLKKMSKKIILTSHHENQYCITLSFLRKPLLILRLVDLQQDKVIFIVAGGLLAKKKQKGTFTFFIHRELNLYTIALECFQPSLPWPIYQLSQAIIHEIVMKKYVQFITVHFD